MTADNDADNDVQKDDWKELLNYQTVFIYQLPELLLVVVRRGGEGGWNIHGFGSLRNGPG